MREVLRGYLRFNDKNANVDNWSIFFFFFSNGVMNGVKMYCHRQYKTCKEFAWYKSRPDKVLFIFILRLSRFHCCCCMPCLLYGVYCLQIGDVFLMEVLAQQ